MALKRTTRTDASFSMSSMTDIVFLLLLFFLVTSTLINPNALKLLLPKSTGQVNAKPMVSVSLVPREGTDSYVYCLNGDEENMLNYDELAPALQELIGGEEDPTFSIYTDEKTPVGEVVAVMNVGKKLDYKVILATRPE